MMNGFLVITAMILMERNEMNTSNTSVPYIVYESEAARHERTIKRILVAFSAICLLMLGASMEICLNWKKP